jgi:NADH dehydrogenase FAD-containing subunit
VRGCAPTAQAAYQQGKYLGRLLRDTDCDVDKINLYEQFSYINYGALAYVGASKGVAELRTMLWNNPLEILVGMKHNNDGNDTKNNTNTATTSTTVIDGGSAFFIWRSLYFSKLLSDRNKTQVGFDWLKTSIFGRDISSPYKTVSMQKNDK